MKIFLAALVVGRLACINGVELEIERFNESPAGQILIAEKQLERGHPQSAAARVREQFPNIRALDAKAPPLALRAERIYALAIVRTEGKLESEKGWTPWANFEWAIETLKDLDAKKPNNPAVQADLAEARTMLSRTKQDGIAVLEELDRRDLLGSAWAYVALARARRESDDDGGSRAALRRCAMMSTDRTQCTLKT